MKRWYLQWILANGWSEMLGLGGTGLSVWLLGLLLGKSSSILAILSTALGVVLVGATLEGALVGYAQARVLRTALPSLPPTRWVSATAIGAAVAWTLGMVPRTLFALSDATGGAPPASLGGWKFLLAAAMGLLLGPVLGVPQWLVLRRHLPHSGLWIPANALGWALGMPVIFLGASALPTQPSIGLVLLAVGTVCLLCGLCVGAVHGAVLVWMLSRVVAPTLSAAGPAAVASPGKGEC